MTVRRGIREELGPDILTHIISIKNITPYPVYYLRDYGPENGNRVDRQFTFLNLVLLDAPGESVDILEDEEVSDLRWISLSDLGEWVEKESMSNQQGKKDDQGGLCHVTITELFRLCIKRLKVDGF
eukprot:CAMPEP_0195531334 /NCGR_PEP_ID=MMETSP0794_2-20130614/35077_1 /TAXON_ID=515487 /ORGANISM="Stephanopyxis turris, Strain CCMP 815" /LENGTH=125 /DNA_ID=CAMNT_0040663095 /DNA_START=420 /DNA_END=797 /DNA_ORIENTATION=+